MKHSLLLIIICFNFSLAFTQINFWEETEWSEKQVTEGEPQYVFKKDSIFHFLHLKYSLHDLSPVMNETNLNAISENKMYKFAFKVGNEKARFEDVVFFQNQICFLISTFDSKSEQITFYLSLYKGQGVLATPIFLTKKLRAEWYGDGYKISAGKGSIKEKSIRAVVTATSARLVVSNDSSFMALFCGDSDFKSNTEMNNWSIVGVNSNFEVQKEKLFFANSNDIFLDNILLKDSTSVFAIGVEGIHLAERGYYITGTTLLNPIRANYIGKNHNLISIDLINNRVAQQSISREKISQYSISVVGSDVLFVSIAPKNNDDDIGILEIEKFEIDSNNLCRPSKMVKRIEVSMKGELDQDDDIVFDEAHLFFTEISNGVTLLVSEFKTTYSNPGTTSTAGGVVCIQGDIAIHAFDTDSDLDVLWDYRMDRKSFITEVFVLVGSQFHVIDDKLIIFATNNHKNLSAISGVTDDDKKKEECATMTIVSADGKFETRAAYDHKDSPAWIIPRISTLHEGRLYFFAQSNFWAGYSFRIGKTNVLFE